MKKIILFSIAIFMIQGVSYTQLILPSTEAVRGIHIYLEGNSGTLVDNTSGYFSGNEIELGLQYYQSFTAVPWLKMIIQGAVLGSFSVNNINLNNKPDSSINSDWQYNGRNNAGIGIKDIEIGLEFASYYYFGVNHNFLLKNLFVLPFQIAGDHRITVYSELDIQPFYIGTIKNTSDPSLEASGVQNSPHLDLFSIGLEYQVNFARAWSYSTKIALRSSGASATISGSTLPNVWEVDSLTAFISNMHLRWDNTMHFKMDNGFYIWGSIRYQIDRLVPHPRQTEVQQLIGKTLHDVYLHFGLGYQFSI
ncbi:MAG: hypothetical protein ACRCWI_08135 [Brevinema sp.]